MMSELANRKQIELHWENCVFGSDFAELENNVKHKNTKHSCTEKITTIYSSGV